MMWEDMAELILSKKEIFEGVLRLLENNEEFGDSYNLMMKTRASTYSALFKTALKMDKDLEKQNMLSQTISKSKTIVEAILAPIIWSASKSDDPNIAMKELKVNVYDERNLIKIPFVLQKLIKNSHKAAEGKLDEEE
jgi:hypothetical protein